MFSTIGKLSRIIRTGIAFKPNLIDKTTKHHQNGLILKHMRCCSTNVKTEKEDVNSNPNIPSIESIVGDDPKLKHKLQVLMLEIEVLRQEGHLVPNASFLSKSQWQELLKLGSRTGRVKFLRFLFKSEKTRENEQLKKEKKREERKKALENLPPQDDSHLVYALGHNNIFLRFYDTTMNHFFNYKLIQAMQFGQKLVIDCGFEKNMVMRENINCAKQLMLIFGDNRVDIDPFDIHFCNVNRDGPLMHALHNNIKTLYEPSFPVNLHKSSYTSIFPKEKLVYLTPHARESMAGYDHDAIYIVGAIVDKSNQDALSFAKAKKEGIKMQKLPLDKHLLWGSGGSKRLTLNQVVAILLDLKRTNDWKYAFRHIPKRKILSADQIPPPLSKLRKWDKKVFNQTDKQKRWNYKVKSIFNE